MGIGNAGLGVLGIGDPAYPMAFGTIGGAAAPMGTGTSLGDPGQAPSSLVGASGFGRNKILPAMGILSGIGSIMTNVAPLMGTFGMAGLATGAVLQGLTAPVLAKYEKASNRLVVSADMVLGTKIRNIETVVKQMEAQEDIIKKLLKEQNETNSKALQDLGG
jgi:hypothetical protein